MLNNPLAGIKHFLLLWRRLYQDSQLSEDLISQILIFEPLFINAPHLEYR
jgi:hypothetical protein